MSAERWTLVTDQDELHDASRRIAQGEGPFGVDTERASGYRYSNRAYLVQVYRRGAGTFLFDPTGISDFSPLASALTGDEWVLHAADQDLPSLREIGLDPQALFDTELGSRLLGLERVGLGYVTAELLDVTLEKAHSAADWSTRPLPEPWLEYAALDVALLPDLRDAVKHALEEQGKLDYAFQEFDAVLRKAPKPKPEDPWRKVAGNKLRSPRQLAMVRELWTARDTLAKSKDIAPGRLIPDASIVAAVLANPRSPEDLASLKTFRGRASRTELNRWWKAILRGKTTAQLPGPPTRAPNTMPNHRAWPQRFPDAAERLSELRAVATAESERQHIPTENLIPPSVLRGLAWEPPAIATPEAVAERLSELGARPWQIGIVAPILCTVFVDNE
ncbi:HRDC domain-containing protein [Leucobacter denitrificans]|uniref:Ribonuclease D n=1 Tax=Leucobacter denitrificans TaxID=683042 RepID=A0A7G9S5P4_9MICO|nr:HRDC domain-containing protein [Leucobacter denitrificans]QNN63169.1 ribonuclease D [Leucobacter denitrificans]